MEMMDVKRLKSHPRNSEFFDDITGDAWEAFLESIRTSGVIEPVIVTTDYVIVSGHQRIRACKELGIVQTLVDIRRYENDDEILKQLIETNIRQRGVGNPNPVKLGRCIKELERIYGIEKGGDRKSKEHNVPLITQDDLAQELGLTRQHLRRYKSLTDLIPELQDAVQTGTITATTAMGVVKKLSPEEQQELAESLLPEQKYTQRDIQLYIDKIKDLESRKIEVVEKIPDDYEQLQKRVKELESRKPEVQIKEVMVESPNYKNLKNDFDFLNKEKQKLASELSKAKKQISEYENRPQEEKAQIDLEESAESFIISTYNYLKKAGGLAWVIQRFDQIPKDKQKDFLSAVNTLQAFATTLIDNLGGYGIE